MARSYPYEEVPRLPEGDVRLDTVLGGKGPIELEIGSGRGHFVIERVSVRPDVRLLAFEVKRKWSSLSDARLEKEGFSDRARVLCEDAREALKRLGPDAVVSAVFVHFPDPWWKTRHRKRLVVADTLVDEVCRLLEDGGVLFVQTDVDDRADEYEALLNAHEDLETAGDSPGSARMAENPYGARSNREKRCDEDGLPVNCLRFRRRARTATSEL
ncbi:hypothetical protein JYT22_00755 [Endomicrobium sp. AH-315-J14]|nr:hypothetical protein [Endomicrobium sp. AH-315-J14]